MASRNHMTVLDPSPLVTVPLKVKDPRHRHQEQTTYQKVSYREMIDIPGTIIETILKFQVVKNGVGRSRFIQRMAMLLKSRRTSPRLHQNKS
jgi:hypothetical protein